MNFKSIAFTTSFVFISGTVSASVEEDFKECAATALSQHQVFPKSIVVDNETNDSKILDHNHSSKLTEYKMAVSTKAGKRIGAVSCTFSSEGQLQNAYFLSKI